MKTIFTTTFPGPHGGAATVIAGRTQLYGDLQKRLVPCSTFKFVLALAGLESGIIPSARTVFRWNGEKIGRPEWQRDMDLITALQESSEWYFRVVARKLGPKELRAIVSRLDYGSGWTGTRPEDSWHDGTLTISPAEQAHFASKLAAGALPFAAAHQATVRESLRVPETGAHVLWGKTGSSAKDAQGRSLGWYVGAYTDSRTTVAFAIVRHRPGMIGPAVRAELRRRLI